MYGETVVTVSPCPKWFVKFCAADVSQSGRPVEVDSDQIETLIENNQHYTTHELAKKVKISKSSTENYLYHFNRFDVWVQHKQKKS